MKRFKQWINWKSVTKSDGKVTKIPVNTQGATINAHDPSYWMSHDEAVATGLPIAFVFTSKDPFFFLDIDNALIDGAWDSRATDLCAMFAGCGVEVSQSNTGLHIIGQGQPTLSSNERPKKNKENNLEFYTEGRFIAIARPMDEWSGDTGMQVPTEVIDAFFEKYMPTDYVATVITDDSWTTTNVEGSYPLEDDDALIEKALMSESIASMFGGDQLTFRDLWERNVPAIGHAFPHEQNTQPYDASRADAALAQRLAFWTGGNCERVKSLMMKSALKRDKWSDRSDYLTRTITGAVARQDKYYDVGKPVDIPKQSDVPQSRTGLQLLARDQQLEFFKGCVYVTDLHRMFIPNGQFLKPEQFNARFGGYIFTLDDTNEKTTRKAWEAFTESQHTTFPKVDSFAFRPLVEPGAIIEEEGIRLVNTYVPVHVTMFPGDVTPFLTHLNKLFPNERDREIILSYMAAVVQYKGYKIQWSPLIQGCEGNGKTLFTRCVAYAVGHRYTHLPPASEIGEKFNAWVFEKLFIGVEDIYVPQQKMEVLEILKPMITSDRLARRAMQQDQSMHDICANFMFNSNHKDAIRKTENDRRFAVFYTPQQSAADIKRDGMDGDYFPNLYKWLKDKSGYEQVAHYLANYPIQDEFNPTKGCQRAPITSSTFEAVSASMGSIEQEIIDRVEQGEIGFKEGWISSVHLDMVLRSLRAERMFPHSKRRDLMRNLGYDWHPALDKGRVNTMLSTDFLKKPKLFIKDGSPHLAITEPREVARQYEDDQKALNK